MKQNVFTAWSDGSCDNMNPQRPGGASYIIFDSNDKEIKRASKGFIGTSNNRMEILAIMSIVNSLPPNSSVTIHSDSQYSINVLSGKWCAHENLDQIRKYWEICSSNNIKVTFVWVRGHKGNEYNELCDQMARGEYNKMCGTQPKHKHTHRSKKKAETIKGKNTAWTNIQEEQYYSQITTKGRRKQNRRK